MSDFVSIPPSLASDPNVSLKAKGLYLALAAIPREGLYKESELIAMSRGGRDAVRGAIKELIRTGWLLTWRQRDEDGCFEGTGFRLMEVKR